MKTEVEKIILNVINDFNGKWTSHTEKDAGVSEYAEKIVKLFSQADVSGSLCHSCNANIAEEFIPKCYCPECGNEWRNDR